MSAKSLRSLFKQTINRGVSATLVTGLLVASLGSAVPVLLNGSASAATPANAYNTIPGSLDGSYPSLGYAATSTSEFGDYVKLSAGSGRYAQSVSVNFTNWACGNDFTQAGSTWTPNRTSTDACQTNPGATFPHEITVNVYSVNNGGPTPAVGSLLKSVTKTVHVPFRPSYDARCAAPSTNVPFGGKWFDESTNTCVNGKSFTETFDFSSYTTALPNDVIVTAAFNTSSYGTSPMGQNGPYDSLNFSAPAVSPSHGTDASSDAVFWKTSYPGYDNTLKQDSGWTGNVPLIQVVTVADDTAPLINFTSPTSWPTAFQTGPNASFTANDDLSGVASTSIKVNRLTWPFNQVKDCSSATATVSCNLSDLTNGRYRLVATATDNAGNVRTETHDFYIDSSKPSVNIVTPGNNQWVNSSFAVAGTAFDLVSGVDRVEYDVDEITALGGTKVSDVSNGTASGTSLWGFGVSGLDQGYYRVTVMAYDEAGNTRTDDVDVRVDTSDPTVTFLNPLDFSNPFSVGPNFSIKATDTSGSGIAGTWLRIYNQDGTAAKICAPSPSNMTSCNSSSLGEGSYYVVADALDKAGNTTSVRQDFVIDSTAPVATVNSQTSSTALPTLTGAVDDTDASVTVTVNGHTYSAVVSGNSWSAQVTHLLSNGTYDVVATATDLAGNAGNDATSNELTVAVPVATSSTNTTITVSSIVGSNGGGSNGSPSGDSRNQQGQVLGSDASILSTSTDKSSEDKDVKGTTTDNDKKKTENSSNFLGLGWWWIPLIVAAILLFLAWLRRRNQDTTA